MIILAASFSYAQDSKVIPTVKKTPHDLTISYTIEVKSRKGNNGIGETYNGGAQTIFSSNGAMRLRQVSLMRMQSIFILAPGNTQQVAVIVKESGKEKSRTNLNEQEWKQFNRKYDNAACALVDGTEVVAGYLCRKAMIKLSNGKIITAFYTSELPYAEIVKAQPGFACLPGLVLKYEYKHKKGTLTYTATSVSLKPIDQNILKAPSSGYTLKKYSSAVD